MVAFFTVVLSRGFTVCLVVVREVVCCCVCALVRVFLEEFCVLFVLFATEVVARFDVCWVVTVGVAVRFDVARTVFAVSANVVWDTDKPRHTAKNSIILFIP